MVTTSRHPQIRVSALTKEELRRLGEKGESFDDIIRRLIVVYSKVSDVMAEERLRPAPGEGGT